MKPLPMILAAASALPASVGATTSEPAASPLANQLLAIERDILRAYVTRDTARLAHDLAREYVHTNLVGQRETKAEEIAEFKPGGAFTVQDGSVDHPVATRYGNVAILRADVHWIGASYQPPDRQPVNVSGTYSVTRVYVWRNRRWQLAASHASRQPPLR